MAMKIISYTTYSKKYWWARPAQNGCKFCGEDYGYGMFKTRRPKEVAKAIIEAVFAGKDIENYVFIYIPHYYRGKNNLQDRIEVYYRKKFKWEK